MMVWSTWAKLGGVLGLFSAQPRRRPQKLRGNFGFETEQMENRALLSAVSSAVPDNHAVVIGQHIGKAASDPPDVNNSTWTISGDVSGTVQFTQQKRNKVNIQVDALGMEVNAKGHFKKAHPQELTATVRAPNTVTGHGKVVVKVQVTFENTPVPNTFDGAVAIKSQHLNLHVTGERQV